MRPERYYGHRIPLQNEVDKMLKSMTSQRNKSPEKGAKKKVNKIDEHIEQAGIDNLESFTDPQTNVIYYRLKVLGKGGFAKVYKCRRGEPYKRTDAEVALKVIPKSRIAKPSQRMKIDAEVQIQNSLSHANIVKLLHNFEDNIKICLVLELCERKSLTSLLKQHAQGVPQPEVAEIVRQITLALQYIHNKGIVHRDLKLGNILLDHVGIAKLGDFGLAMYYKEAKPGNICGTPNFIAPEVLNDSVHEPASDVWALGCVMFTLLSGKPAFEYTNMRDTYKRIVKLAYKIPDRLSAPAKHLISSILIKDPRRRPMHSNILNHQFITGIETKLRSRTMSSENALASVTNTRRQSSASEDQFHSINKRKHSIGGGGPDNPAVDRRRSYATQDTGRLAQQMRPFRGASVARPLDMSLNAAKENQVPVAPSEPPLNETLGLVNMTPADHRNQFNRQITNQFHVVWVMKWVDYTNRYGFAYQLSDGKIGVNMHGGSYIVLHRDGQSVDDYSQSTNRAEQFALEAPPAHTQRHTRILKYFMEYMKNNLCAGASNLNYLSNEAAQLTMSVRLRCWKSYKQGRNKQSMGMLLNNDTLQVNFIEESVKIIVHAPFIPGNSVVMLIDESRSLQIFVESHISMFPPSHREQLQFVHHVLHDLHSSFPCYAADGQPRSILCAQNWSSHGTFN